jgi:hypothetical protein
VEFDLSKFEGLPPDYGSLTAEGQRQARVACIRNARTPREYIIGHLFFRHYYLASPGNEQAFYGEEGVLPPADGHFLILNDFARFPLCVEAFPRGGGKSTIMKEMASREIIGWNYRGWTVCVSTEKMISDKAAPIKRVIEQNDRVIADFG